MRTFSADDARRFLHWATDPRATMTENDHLIYLATLATRGEPCPDDDYARGETMIEALTDRPMPEER